MSQGPFHTVLRLLHRVATSAADGEATDRQLLERFAGQHDEAAFAALVRRHGALVLGVCWGVLRQAEDAEDAFQATFLVLARRAARVRWQESVGAWLHEVAHRLALKARAASARREERERRAAARTDSEGE